MTILRTLSLLLFLFCANSNAAQLTGDSNAPDTAEQAARQLADEAKAEALQHARDKRAIAAILPPRWWTAGAVISCPTCEGNGQLKQACTWCFSTGKIACNYCLENAYIFAPQTTWEALPNGGYGGLVSFRSVDGVEMDKKSRWMGPGEIDCVALGCVAGKRGEDKCAGCKGKAKVSCNHCKKKGVVKCFACSGKKKVKRACEDCLGSGVLPDPSRVPAAAIATCLWCSNSGARTCADCTLQGDEPGRISSFLHAYGAEPANRPLMGVASQPCAVCTGSKSRMCFACDGTKKGSCISCMGTGYELGSGFTTSKTKCKECKGKKTFGKCRFCDGKGKNICISCRGEGEAVSDCILCAGDLVRSCAGCFRGGVHLWELYAKHLEDAGKSKQALLYLKAIPERLALHAAERVRFRKIIGYDWVTGNMLSLSSIGDLEQKLAKQAQADIASLEKRMAIPDKK